MSCTCGCCQGIATITPTDTFNPPGHRQIRYRLGTHGDFRESMQARLSAQPALHGLTTRDPSDPSMALLDCFALIADILTFYQERIANEGYLRTATESYSLAQLGKLVGYQARPALGSSTHLAYTLDPGATTRIPAGSGARSVPRQDELPQTFETSDELDAQYDWNILRVATTGPVSITDYGGETGQPDDVRTIDSVGVAGTTANVKSGDRLLFIFGSRAVVRAISGATADFATGKTIISLTPQRDQFRLAKQDLLDAVSMARKTAVASPTVTKLDSTYLERLETRLSSRSPLMADQLFGNLLREPDVSLPAVLERLAEAGVLAQVHESASALRWYDTYLRAVREAGEHLVRVAEAAARRAPGELLAVRQIAQELLCPPTLSGRAAPGDCDAASGLAGLSAMLPALQRAPTRPPRSARDAVAPTAALYRPDSDVFARLLTAAHPRLAGSLRSALPPERLAPPPTLSRLEVFRTKARVASTSDGETTVVTLDAVYDGITEGNWVAIGEEVRRVRAVRESLRRETVGEAAVDIPSTVLSLNNSIHAVKGQPLYAAGEELTALGDPITDDVDGDEIELSRVYDGLQPGRFIVIAGDRTDVPFTSGVDGAEVAMVVGISQRVDPDKPGSAARTVLQLTGELSYRYRRDTVTVYGNVIVATQGETRRETLGSGDASVPNQSFVLRQTNAQNPLTSLPAGNAAGSADTLDVTVSGVRWQPTEVLADAAATDHVYGSAVGGDHSVAVQFGDGVRGARPPTGVENISATFRVGAGRGGNVAAGQISQLASQPLGVSAVTNPIAATGGADGDKPADMRASSPLRMLALDRLLSVRDYEDFTRARAGIGKASAAKLFDGDRQVVHITLAGVDDAPIEPVSELFAALQSALVKFGDIGLPVNIDARELILLVLRAGIKVAAQYSWDLVEPAVRAALSQYFSFARRDLGQDAYLSEAVAVMQSVPGVEYVDVDVFHGVSAMTAPLDLVTLSRRLAVRDRAVHANRASFVEDRVEANPGETLTHFARRIGLTLDELCRLNPALVDGHLAEGDALVVRRGIRAAQLALLPAGVPEAFTLWRIR